jgi:pimeloyl-ACP methyl ester carboxylesterase
MAPAFGFVARWAETAEGRSWREAGFLDVYHYGERRTRRLSYQLLADGLRYEGFPDFKQPALIFHGIHDSVVLPQSSTDFAESHPNAGLRLLDSDHQLLNVLEIIWKEAGPFLLP